MAEPVARATGMAPDGLAIVLHAIHLEVEAEAMLLTPSAHAREPQRPRRFRSSLVSDALASSRVNVRLPRWLRLVVRAAAQARGEGDNEPRGRSRA